MTENQNVLAREILAFATEISVATNCADGWPHMTAASFVSDGLVLYFGAASGSQHVINITRDPRVSVTAVAPPESWRKARSLSLVGAAMFVTECGELGRVIELMIARYGANLASNGVIDMAQTRIIRVNPKTMALLDCPLNSGERPGFAVAHQAAESQAA